jgi:hypothetical protein
MSRCKVALGSSSSVGRRVIVGRFLLYQSSRLVMIMFAIGAGVWYRDRCLQNSWRALALAATHQSLLHWSMWLTVSLRFPQAKHRRSILLPSACAHLCIVGVQFCGHTWRSGSFGLGQELKKRIGWLASRRCWKCHWSRVQRSAGLISVSLSWLLAVVQVLLLLWLCGILVSWWLVGLGGEGRHPGWASILGKARCRGWGVHVLFHRFDLRIG